MASSYSIGIPRTILCISIPVTKKKKILIPISIIIIPGTKNDHPL